MTKQTILVGTYPNDKSGDLLRNAFIKVNDNFTEVYNHISGETINPTFTGIVNMSGATSVELPDGYLEKYGTNYIIVSGKGTPSQNATELQAAYDAAKTMPRYAGEFDRTTDDLVTIYKGQTFQDEGSQNSDYMIATNTVINGSAGTVTGTIISEAQAKSTRTTIVVAPGNYDFGATAFVHGTAYIDIVSLTGDADVFLKSTEHNTNSGNNYGIKVTANNTLVKGINCGTNTFYIANSLDYLTCTNCTGGDYSFGGYGDITLGTFTNCTGGDRSFGSSGIALGSFTNCTGGYYSFGGYGTASGTFTNCIGGKESFGSSGIALGTFINCTGGDYSFGGGGTASGIFTNCTGGIYSFGSSYVASGIFTNCTGGVDSFGGDGGVITSIARLYYCRLTSGTFTTPDAGGKIVLCIDGSNNVKTI
jgi:hypothetical protein